jgi:hypothetical protein
MNDTDLKSLLAKMLPETVYLDAQNILCWPVYQQCGHPVLDTELLHLASLVEAGLTEDERPTYLSFLTKKDQRTLTQTWWPTCHATWQQRVTALAAVKGVTK